MVTENKPQQDNNNINIVNENTNDEFVEQFWVKNVLPHKVETLPYEKLSVEEQKIISKIRNNETLTNDELKTIKQTTADYSEALEKYDAEETIKAYQEFNDAITTEQELLNLVEEQNKPQKLKMNCHFKQGVKLVEFTIYPIDDSRAVQMTQLHADIYQDLSPKENQILLKQQKGEKLSKFEEDVIEHINKKVMESSMEDRMHQINFLLANQVTPPSNGTVDDRIKFWEKFPFNDKMSLYLKIEDMLGLTEHFDDELFPNEQ